MNHEQPVRLETHRCGHGVRRGVVVLLHGQEGGKKGSSPSSRRAARSLSSNGGHQQGTPTSSSGNGGLSVGTNDREGQARRQQAELPLDPGLLQEHMRFIEWQEQQRLKAPAKAAGPSPPAAAPASAAPEAQRPAGLPLQPRRASAVPEAQQLAGPPPLAAAPASAAPAAKSHQHRQRGQSESARSRAITGNRTLVS